MLKEHRKICLGDYMVTEEEYSPATPVPEDIEKQRKAVGRFQERGRKIITAREKVFLGGIIRRPKSLRETARITGVSRYKLKKEFKERDVYEREMIRREARKDVKRVQKKYVKTVKKLVKKIRPYMKTEKWYKTRKDPRGEYRSPQEFEGRRARGLDEPKFHVGTFSAQQTELLDLKKEKITEVPLKSPIEDQLKKPVASRLLDLTSSDMNRGSLLDTSSGKRNDLLDLKKKRK